MLPHPAIGKLRTLELLSLDGNPLGDAGLATVAAALDNGVLPALRTLSVCSDQASHQAMAIVDAALFRRTGGMGNLW